jgi:hypothetical protein
MTAQARKTTPRSTERRTSKSSSVSEISDEQVRVRAYEIYLARGPQSGDHTSDWLQAERELRPT